MTDLVRRPRALLGAVAALWLGTALVMPAQAQQYPDRPIKVTVGFPAGSGADILCRWIIDGMAKASGATFVVENKPGAAGNIGSDAVAKSKPDGYMLLMVASTTFINSVLRGQNLERDLTPVSLATTAPMVMVVHPSVPTQNVKDLIALARTRPGTLNYGSDGVGGTTHLCGELFNLLANVKLVHVPYKGAGDSILATAGGQVDMNFASAPATLPLLNAGKFRALAVSSPKRSSLLPALPTLDESGLAGFDVTTWFGVLAPAAVPKDVIAQLSAAIAKVVNTPEMKEAINKQGMETQANSPEQFAEFMRRQSGTIARLVEKAGMKAE